jgi:hypothetical protein
MGSDFSSVQSLRTPVRITTSTPSCARKVYFLFPLQPRFRIFLGRTPRCVYAGCVAVESGRDMMSKCFPLSCSRERSSSCRRRPGLSRCTRRVIYTAAQLSDGRATSERDNRRTPVDSGDAPASPIYCLPPVFCSVRPRWHRLHPYFRGSQNLLGNPIKRGQLRCN